MTELLSKWTQTTSRKIPITIMLLRAWTRHARFEEALERILVHRACVDCRIMFAEIARI